MKIVYKALAALALSALATTASAQQYPEKPIRDIRWRNITMTRARWRAC